MGTTVAWPLRAAFPAPVEDPPSTLRPLDAALGRAERNTIWSILLFSGDVSFDNLDWAEEYFIDKSFQNTIKLWYTQNEPIKIYGADDSFMEIVLANTIHLLASLTTTEKGQLLTFIWWTINVLIMCYKGVMDN